MSQSPKKVSCVCGAVTIETAKIAEHFHACHCGTCRQWGSAAFMAIECPEGLTISGEENVKRFSSSEWAERGFCLQCGTHLFYHLKDSPIYHLSLGLLNPEHSEFAHQYFIDQKPNYYEFGNPTKMLTGEELFKLFTESPSPKE